MAEGKLTKDAKIHVVTSLAMYEKPAVVQKELKELFGIEVSLPAVCEYDPGSTGDRVPKKWKSLFDETRAKFLDDKITIPIANKTFRLRELNRQFDNQKLKPAGQQNPAEIRALLEQAAREAGNSYTNRLEHTGKGGKALEVPTQAVVLYMPDNGRGDSTTGPPSATPEQASPPAKPE